MDRPVKRRRFICAAASGFGGGVAGCLGSERPQEGDSHEHDDHKHGDREADNEEVDPALRIGGTVLSDAFPIELVEPDVEPFEGYATDEQRVANVHWHGSEISHWHFQPVAVPLGGTRRVRTRFVDQNDRELQLGRSGAYRQSVHTADGTVEDLVSIGVEGAHVTFSGGSTGIGRVFFQLHDGNGETAGWTSPELEIEVTE
jgi:hypothetical protein